MVYLVFGTGEPSPLDKEHIINTMFKAARYGKKIIFIKGSACDVALQAALEWKRLNEFSVDIMLIDENEPGQKQLIPSIFDCILYFISEETDKNPEFIQQQKVIAEEGIRVEKYVLGTWDKQGLTH